MTPDARLQSAIELLTELETGFAAGGRRNRIGPPADRLTSDFFRKRRYAGAKDRADISNRIYRILRCRARLCWQIAKAAGGPMPDRAARRARLLVIADLVLNEDVRERGIKRRFANSPHGPEAPSGAERRIAGALEGRRLSRGDQPAWVRGEYPEWLHGSVIDRFGGDAPREMAALIESAPLDLRANLLKADRDAVRAALAEDGFEAAPTALSPIALRARRHAALPSLAAFRDGLVEVQDEGSQIVALLTGAEPGHRVCDFCAGAGGKTLALAAAMRNRGRIVACDVDARRGRRAGERLKRAGVRNAESRVLKSERDKWVKRQKQRFDRVLVDAPCTGTGTWRRNPDGRWRLAPEDLEALTAMQARILDSAARMVKPGGRLVYATCSILPEENACQVEAFLDRTPAFETVPVPDVWRETVGGDCPTDAAALQLTPARHGADGFFCAILRRRAAAELPDRDETLNTGR